MDVIGIGSASLDFCGTMDKYPDWNSKGIIDELHISGGGSSSNTVTACSKLGLKAGFIGTCSDDYFGNMILFFLQKDGVDVSNLVLRKGYSSQTAFCFSEPCSGRRTVFRHRGTVPGLRFEDIRNDYIRCAKILHFDLRHPEACLAIADTVKKNGTKIYIDAGGEFGDSTDLLLNKADYLFFSHERASLLTGEKDPLKMIRSLSCFDPQIIGITLGYQGCIIRTGVSIEHYPSFKIDHVIDSTGAGDAFHGGFIYSLLSGFDIPESVNFASAVAALKCQSVSARNGLPDLDKVRQFLLSHPPLVPVSC